MQTSTHFYSHSRDMSVRAVFRKLSDLIINMHAHANNCATSVHTLHVCVNVRTLHVCVNVHTRHMCVNVHTLNGCKFAYTLWV